MILVDKNIKELVNNNTLIIKNYNPENLGAVSYDLTIDKVIFDEKECNEYYLKPQEFVIVKTNEELKIPENIIGKIEEKNSLIRLGLVVSGPVYQPGHQTYCYLRVYNISNKKIKLQKDFKIAQIFFEKLTEIPNETYNQKKNASFNNESEYLKYGKYEDDYKKILK